MSTTHDAEREAFEEWYMTNALDPLRTYIGSRECGLQWLAWKARAELFLPAGAEPSPAHVDSAVAKAGVSDTIDGSPKWIKVSDQLPAKFVEVLIVFRDVTLPSTGQYTNSKHDHDGWCFPSENDPEETGPVTHWMPLPEPYENDACHAAVLLRLEN